MCCLSNSWIECRLTANGNYKCVIWVHHTSFATQLVNIMYCVWSDGWTTRTKATLHCIHSVQITWNNISILLIVHHSKWKSSQALDNSKVSATGALAIMPIIKLNSQKMCRVIFLSVIGSCKQVISITYDSWYIMSFGLSYY